MKKLLILALLLATPAMAQRGGNSRPLQNYAETCAVYGSVSTGASCSGYPKQWCVNYTTNIIYACDPNTGLWDAVGSGAGGGGGTTIIVESSNSAIVSTCSTLNFGSDFSVADAGSGQADIGVNDSALSVNLASGTGLVAVVNGGTGANNATDARSNLGAAASGSNGDITALTNLTTPLPVNEGGSGLSAVAVNKMYVGSASNTFVAKTVPDCSTGSNIQFKQSGTCSATGETAPCWDCAADGASGTGTIKDIQEEGSLIGASGSGTALDFVGSAITAAGTGATKTITLSQSGSGSSVIDNAYAVTAGAGLSGGGTLTGASISLATASQEAGFLADGGVTDLTTGVGLQGKAQVMDNGVLQYTDGAASPLVRQAALADASGNASTGDDAASFFQAGIMEMARGGTGTATLGSNTQMAFTSGSALQFDPGFTYVAATDTATVGVLVTSGGADGTWGDTFRNNTIEPSAPGASFTLLFAMADELYKKDQGDSGNERLMLNSGNVSGDFTCNAAGLCDLGSTVVGATELASTAVVAGSYTAADITVDADGRITAAASGAGGAGDITAVGPYTSGAAFADGAVSSGTAMFTWEGTTSDTAEFVVAAPAADPAGDTTVTFPATTDTLVGKATNDTFTNKTLNVESTGNDVTTMERTWFVAAGCNNATAASFFDLRPTAAAAAACLTDGTTATRGVLDFDAAADEEAQISFMLTSDFVSGSALDVTIRWIGAGAGNTVWGIQTGCAGNNETHAPSWNTASTVIDASLASATAVNQATISGVTKTGCDASDLINIRIFRDADDGVNDTMTGDARLIGFEVAYRRLQ